jgi:hypothetical protein
MRGMKRRKCSPTAAAAAAASWITRQRSLFLGLVSCRSRIKKMRQRIDPLAAAVVTTGSSEAGGDLKADCGNPELLICAADSEVAPSKFTSPISPTSPQAFSTSSPEVESVSLICNVTPGGDSDLAQQIINQFSVVGKIIPSFFSRKIVWAWTAIFICLVILCTLVHNTRQNMCVSSTQMKNMEWMRSLYQEFQAKNRPRFSMLDLQPILTETSDFSFTDKFQLWLGCRLFLIESVGRFKQRNPLEKYDKIRFYLESSIF